jgi:hypothetical protein
MGAAAALVAAAFWGWLGWRRVSTIETDHLKDQLSNALRAKEIDNEVEALSPDALRERSRKWVRGVNRD